MTTRRVLLALALVLPACSSPAAPRRSPITTPVGVPPGAPVIARFNPDNAVVASVRASAAQVGLGDVNAVGFRPDCSPGAPGHVIVCRNPSYTNGQATATRGPLTCVVELDPKLGGGPRADRITTALRHCLT